MIPEPLPPPDPEEEPLPLPDPDEDDVSHRDRSVAAYYGIVLLAATAAAIAVLVSRPGGYAEAAFVFLFVLLAVYVARLIHW
jgi:hypothetical protein